MTENQEIEYIRFGEIEYDEDGKPIRERFGIGEVMRRNRKTISVRLVLPFQSWRKKYPIGAGFRVPHRYCEAAFKVVCRWCGSIDYFSESDIRDNVEVDCECRWDLNEVKMP